MRRRAPTTETILLALARLVPDNASSEKDRVHRQDANQL